MQCLAMVVLASFIGMPGLGQKLLQLLQALKIGRSIEIGITIVLLAVMLDRCTKAWATKQPEHFEKGTPWPCATGKFLIWAGLVAGAFAALIWRSSVPILMTRSAAREAFTISKPMDGIAIDWFGRADATR